ncbi:MAG: polyprenyl synthetase family protein [Firmicutes bacterium]|nr:polyprenyl synthetase family protein [Bacillota bacterium]
MTITKTPLTDLQSLPGLQQVESRLQEMSRGADLWTPQFSSTVTSGGKRLRPALVLLCGSFKASSQQQLIDVATAVELIHTASLVHDDIIDRAAYRRGRPTISATKGNRQAVLYGDFLFARAFTLLTKHGLHEILRYMTQAISLMCEGEIGQANQLFNCQLQEKDYFAYIYKKTAYFLAACCRAGAEASGIPQAQKDALEAFGLYLGYAFQLSDDLLDFLGDSKVTGKPILQDLHEGYLTLPLIKLLKDPLYGLRTRHIIEERDFTDANIAFICSSLHKSGIIAEVKEKTRELIAQAKQNLEVVAPKPARTVLARLADYIVQRAY